MDNPILSGFLLLAAIVIIIVFAYYVTILVGKKTNKLFDGRYTQVIERAIIGLNISITILKINQKIYIIAVQGKTIKLLDILDEKDWRFSNNKNKTLFNTKGINNNFLINKLFGKTKENSSSERYSWNGSDNDE